MTKKYCCILLILLFISCRKQPTACFDISSPKPRPSILPLGIKITLDGSCSSNTSDWTWEFGDGTPRGSGMKIEHQYNKEGTFTLILYTKNGSKIDSAGVILYVQK